MTVTLLFSNIKLVLVKIFIFRKIKGEYNIIEIKHPEKNLNSQNVVHVFVAASKKTIIWSQNQTGFTNISIKRHLFHLYFAEIFSYRVENSFCSK
jgi:hypothetical protein